MGDAFVIVDNLLTIENTSGLLLDPNTHTISEILNGLALNTDAGLNLQFATISQLTDAETVINGRLDGIDSSIVTLDGRLDSHDTELQTHQDFIDAQPGIDSAQDTEITAQGLRLDTAEQGISEHTNLIADNATAIANHLTDTTAHDATQVYFISAGGGTTTRGFFLAGDGATDSVYSTSLDTFTSTNAFKADATVHPIAFANKVFCFSSDAGGSFVSTDGGLTFTAMTTPWNINVLVTSAAVGEYTASGVNALVLGMSDGSFFYSIDGTNFVLDPVTPFSNQILCLTWTNYTEWNFVVHNDTTGVYAFDWVGVSDYWQYTATLPFEPTSLGLDPGFGPIISSPTGTQYFDTNTWTASTLFSTTQVYFNHSGDNLGGGYSPILCTVTGDVYSYTINGTTPDAWALVGTIVEAGTVSALTQYEPNKYIVTFSVPANGLHQIVWFEYPFTNFHYQGGSTSTRNLTGACSAIYADTSPASLTIANNSGAVTCNTVDDAIRALDTANDEIRAAGYITTAALSGYETISNAASTYQTQAGMSSYRTSSAQDTIDGSKYDVSNPAGYQTASDVSTAITSGTSGVFYPANNPDNFVTLSAANGAYYPLTGNPSTFQNPTDVASIIALNVPGFAYLAHLARNIRVVDQVYGVASPVGAQSYNTIANAIATFTGPGTIFLYPGTHVLTGSITMPANCSILGADKKTTTITMTATANRTMFLCAQQGISFQNLTITMNTSTPNVNMKMFEITAGNNSFHIDNVITSINNTATTGSSDIYGIHDTGNEVMTSDALFHIFEMVSTINTSSPAGTVRNVYKAPTTTNFADLHIESSQFYTNSGICIETAGAFQPELAVVNSFIQGATADISQTTGRITLGKGTVLYNANANALNFNYFGMAQTWTFGDDGQLPGGTNYLYRGTATSSATRIPYRINKPTVVCNLFTSQRTAPGAGQTVSYTVFKNATATTLTCTTSGTALDSNNTTVSVSFAAGDTLSIRTINSGGTSADCTVSVDLY